MLSSALTQNVVPNFLGAVRQLETGLKDLSDQVREAEHTYSAAVTALQKSHSVFLR